MLLYPFVQYAPFFTELQEGQGLSCIKEYEMMTVYSYFLPRTDSADLPGDHRRRHCQEAEAIWSPRCGPDLTRGWGTTLGPSDDLPASFGDV